MPWVKGQSGNPLGLSVPKRLWLEEKKRQKEARKSFNKLVEIRENLVLERKQLRDAQGRITTVEVVASISQMVDVCDKIMDRAIGKPRQEVEVKNDDNRPFAWTLVTQSGEELTIIPSREPKLIEYSFDTERAQADADVDARAQAEDEQSSASTRKD